MSNDVTLDEQMAALTALNNINAFQLAIFLKAYPALAHSWQMFTTIYAICDEDNKTVDT